MDHQVIWLRGALDDLDDIAAYIAKDSPAAASKVVEKIRDASRDLAMFPLMGPRVREWDDDNYRQRIIYSYRLIYRVSTNRITILAVWHGARLLPNFLRRRN